ncbi:MAG: fibronectin type III domain-containing protein, partial [Myxococcota bacterium]
MGSLDRSRRSAWWTALGVFAVGGAALVACGSDRDCGAGTVIVDGLCVPATVAGSADTGTGGEILNSGAPIFNGAISASPASPTSILVTWEQASDDFTDQEDIRYDVYVALASGGHDFETPFASVTGQSGIRLFGLETQEQFVVVRAVDSEGNSDVNTTQVSTVPATDNTPPVFGGVTSATAGGSSELVVSWDAATDDLTQPQGMSYAIYVIEGDVATNDQLVPSESNPFALSEFGATSATIVMPKQETTYTVAVRAVDAAGNSDTNQWDPATSAFLVSGTSGTDTEAPVFGGCLTAAPAGAGVTVSFLPAVDDTTEQANIRYNIYAATEPLGQNFNATPIATVPEEG